MRRCAQLAADFHHCHSMTALPALPHPLFLGRHHPIMGCLLRQLYGVLLCRPILYCHSACWKQIAALLLETQSKSSVLRQFVLQTSLRSCLKNPSAPKLSRCAVVRGMLNFIAKALPCWHGQQAQPCDSCPCCKLEQMQEMLGKLATVLSCTRRKQSLT